MPVTIKQGGTVKITVTHRDFDGSLFDPDTQDNRIYDPSDVERDQETNPTKLSVGIYYYYHTLAEAAEVGTWRVKCKGVESTFVAKEDKTFKVVAA